MKSKSVTSTADVLTDAGMYALLKGVPYDLVGKLGDCIHVERRVYRGKTTLDSAASGVQTYCPQVDPEAKAKALAKLACERGSYAREVCLRARTAYEAFFSSPTLTDADSRRGAAPPATAAAATPRPSAAPPAPPLPASDGTIARNFSQSFNFLLETSTVRMGPDVQIYGRGRICISSPPHPPYSYFQPTALPSYSYFQAPTYSSSVSHNSYQGVRAT